MSKDNVNAFIKYLENEDPRIGLEMGGSDPKTLVAQAEELGFKFSEEDLKSALNTRICNAESLPRPWGWEVARKFGLVRS